MSNAALSPFPSCISHAQRGLIGVVVTSWFALVYFLAARGGFITPLGSAPLPIALGAVAPVLVFLLVSRFSHAFRALILSADLRLISGIQAWRFAGFGFLALYAHGVLPSGFALPAGLGDMAIGLTAPWVVSGLLRRPDFALGRTFMIWNLLGILDLIVAVATGAVSAILATGATGEITTRPMAALPLVLIPAFFVPLFAMLHLAALLQVRTGAKA